MITLNQITKLLFLIILFLQSCVQNDKDDYLKNVVIQNKLNKTIDSLSKEVPIPKYITIYFTASKGKTYVFVTNRISAFKFISKYYFEKFYKQMIIVGFKNNDLEERFANLRTKKPEKVFDDSEEVILYHGKQIVYEVLEDNTIREIRPNQEIWELNDYAQFEPFIPPVKRIEK